MAMPRTRLKCGLGRAGMRARVGRQGRRRTHCFAQGWEPRPEPHSESPTPAHLVTLLRGLLHPTCLFSPDCGVSSPSMTLRPAMLHRDSRPTARPGQHELPSAVRGPDGPGCSARRPPSGGRRQAHPKHLRPRLLLLEVLLNTKQPGGCQLEMTFSGRSQTIARSDFLP